MQYDRGWMAVLERRVPGVFIIYQNRLFHDILRGVLRPESVVGAAALPAVSLGRLLQDLARARPDVVIIEKEADGDTAGRVLSAGWTLARVVVLDLEGGLAREYRVRSIAVRDLEELTRELGLSGDPSDRPSPPDR
jgi:hypothetical protein